MRLAPNLFSSSLWKLYLRALLFTIDGLQIPIISTNQHFLYITFSKIYHSPCRKSGDHWVLQLQTHCPHCLRRWTLKQWCSSVCGRVPLLAVPPYTLGTGAAAVVEAGWRVPCCHYTALQPEQVGGKQPPPWNRSIATIWRAWWHLSSWTLDCALTFIDTNILTEWNNKSDEGRIG